MHIVFIVVAYISPILNGVSMPKHPAVSYPGLWAQTDAFGAWGCAAVLAPH